MKSRVLVDTSTLVSALLRPGSVPERALMKALAGFEVCVSAESLAELETTLAQSKFDRYASSEARSAFMAIIRESAQEFAVNEQDLKMVTPRCRDARDNFLLALALVAEAGWIVSSDQDLLVMNPWRDIRVVTPAEFLEIR